MLQIIKKIFNFAVARVPGHLAGLEGPACLSNKTTNRNIMEYIKSRVRDVIDFPKKGIVFKDLTTVFKDCLLYTSPSPRD